MLQLTNDMADLTDWALAKGLAAQNPSTGPVRSGVILAKIQPKEEQDEAGRH